ncbi:hypothetical protein HN592_00255 [Candidatus Woesearchaeota archaeon]|jgi:hypothetical protein|nr:hypothetical protein [Candidatus Woesearchaeota archaeon]MBT4368762.1 hypothetical protein [Candidatus Woesearchaeota archaeon]MBT7134401.1 hypothetical protein [Candidatus Woesearchaeota archaeon]MBT7442319.1 hypothetical protein [Candidatus Woesearchaeota archaeon]MBT7496886.1 hypothetical protein [Candidatus Woesearchaeota archaeon]
MEKMSLFIKIENYEDVLDLMTVIKGKVNDIKSTFSEIRQIKDEEDTKLEVWKKNMEVIEGKLGNVDRVLFEPED